MNRLVSYWLGALSIALYVVDEMVQRVERVAR